MISNNFKPSWSDIRKRLLVLEKGELISHIKDLYTSSESNKRFLEARFAKDQDQAKSALADFKQKIVYCFFGEHELSDDLPRLRDARKLVSDYRKATKNVMGTLDLMLHYVETGTDFTNTYGDIDEPFYNSLESMLEKFCQGMFQTDESEQAYARFEKRIAALKKAAFHIGWGYGDNVFELLSDLQSRFGDSG